MERIEGWIRTAIAAFFRLLHIPLKENTLQSLVQFVKFGLVGVTNTAVSYVVNILVLKLLQPYHLSWDYVAGNVVAFLLSVLWSFYWNNKYVFRKGEGQKRNLGKALLKTYVAYGLTGIVLANVLSWVWINVFGISKYVAPLINLVISIPLNFIINKFWAFRTQPES
ncbi:MAG: GtrA family protein [Clostridia bacterium]|nr:GtrA family protein [Clostridia bacterium]